MFRKSSHWLNIHCDMFLAWWAERGEQPRRLRRLQLNQPLNDPKLTSGSLSRLGDLDTKVSLSLLCSACSRAARCLLAVEDSISAIMGSNRIFCESKIIKADQSV